MAPGTADWLNALAAVSPDDEPSQAEFFANHPDLRNAESVDLLHEEVLRVLYADPARAERLARAACRLADLVGDPGSRAASLRATGHVNYAGSHYEAAIGCYKQALELLAALGRDLETGRTLTSGLQSLIYLGQYEEAHEWAGRAREIFSRHGDELRLARLASNVGNIHYRQDRYAEALAHYHEAHATLARLGEHRDVAAVLSNMAVCNISLSRFSEALAAYREARDYCEQHGLLLLVAGADYNVAYLHYLQGDFLRAIEMYKASREHCRSAGDAYHAALCDLDEAEIYLELNLNGEAARLAGDAETGFEALGMAYERAKALVTHAISESRRGQARLAYRLFAQARKLFATEQNRLWPALIDLYQAIFLERENRDAQAARLCRRAYMVLKDSLLPGKAALAELSLSRLMLKANDPAGARRIFARAENRLEVAGTPWLRFHAHMVQGQIEEHAGNQASALESYQSARLEIETLRCRLWGDEPKISFLKDKLAVYESLVKLLLTGDSNSNGAARRAFALVQQAKSRSLADSIACQPSSPADDGLPAAQDAEIEEARRDLNSRYRQMERLALSSPAASAAQVEALRHGVRDHEGRLLRLIAAATPDTSYRSGGEGESMTVEAIQAAVPGGAVLLEYYAVKGVLCVCLLDRTGLEVVPLAPADNVRTPLRLLRFQMRKFRLGSDYQRAAAGSLERATDTHLRDLYCDLIEPIHDRLEGATHLIIAPHDYLHHLPFHALRGPNGYLVEEFTVSYAPSATVFALCAQRQPAFAPQSLVLGLPDRLAPHIALEAANAAAVLPNSRLFLGEEATEAALRRFGPQSRFIHIATHGLFRRDNPLFSAIRLGDSHLTLFDLYRLAISAELVALSGCSTGLNVVVGGDELLGLMRGLLLAGAHGVMVSLWDVNDRSTAEFMKSFYQHLGDTGHKAMALQRAMGEIRREYPHPYFWAPFVLAGKYALDESGSPVKGVSN